MSVRKLKKRTLSPPSKETQAAELVTIAWSLTVVTLLFCDLGVGLSQLALRAAEPSVMVRVFAAWLLFSAGVIGVGSLVLLPFVLRMRVEQPPRGFTVLAVVVAVSPLALIAALLFR